MRLGWAKQTFRICRLKKQLAFMKHLLYVGKLEGHEILTFCNRATDPTLPSGCAWYLVLLWPIPTIPQNKVAMILF